MLIEEIMKSPVHTLKDDQTIEDALLLMRQYKIRHIPIVNHQEHLVGIISDRDLKEVIPSSLSEQRETSIYQIPLSKIMTPSPMTGHPMDFVEETAVVFYEHQIGSLPILSEGKIVGILTETDLLYKYIELTGAHQPGSQIEVRVPNNPGILFEVSSVFHEQQTNVLSVLVYPDKVNPNNKILVIRVKTMNPLKIIEGLKAKGFEVLWPNVPGIHS